MEGRSDFISFGRKTAERGKRRETEQRLYMRRMRKGGRRIEIRHLFICDAKQWCLMSTSYIYIYAFVAEKMWGTPTISKAHFVPVLPILRLFLYISILVINVSN